jgi:hypothetical protein
MIAGPSGLAQACAGGDGSSYKAVDIEVQAEAGSYSKEVLEMDASRELDFHSIGEGTLYVLSDEEMQNYEDGMEFEPVVEVTPEEEIEWAFVEKGSYWMVLDNTEGTEEATGQAGIAYSDGKCGVTPPAIEPAPVFLPIFQFELVGMAIGIGLTIGIISRRR